MRDINFCREEVTAEEKMRRYNETYRKKHSGTIFCACGSVFREIGKYSHIRSKKHMNYLAEKDTKNDNR